jgi:rhamnulokinase
MSTSYLAVDLGASSGRAVLGTLAGGRMSLREVHRFATPLTEDGGRLFWNLELLWAEVSRGVALALSIEPRLRSVSVDSWAVDYVPLDARGEPLRAPYSYRDPRTRGRMAEAHARVPAGELYARTGIQMLELNTIYQLLADRAEEWELLQRTRQRLTIADYLLYRLSGRAAIERTMASTTQLLDLASGEWATDLLERLGLPATGWPEVVEPGTVLGRLRTSEAGETGAPLVIASCSHDTAAAVAAVPAETNGPGWAYLSSGTWSLLGAELTAPVLTDAALAANFTNEAGLDGTVRFLRNLTGFWVLQECERQWRAEGAVFDHPTLVAEAGAAPPSAGLLDLDDSRLAERGDMLQRLRECCRDAQLAWPATRGGVVRLVLESLAARYAAALRELEALTGSAVEMLHVVGGGAQNALLCQMTADACGCRVVAGPAEATAFGNLLVQARALGDLPAGLSLRDVVRASSTLRVHEPSRIRVPAAPADGRSSPLPIFETA